MLADGHRADDAGLFGNFGEIKVWSLRAEF